MKAREERKHEIEREGETKNRVRDDSEKNVRSPSVPIFTRRRSWFSYLYPLTPYL